MAMLKKNDCESLKNYQANVQDEICFNKVASRQCADCNSRINRFHHKKSLEYVLKTSLRRIF